MKVECLTCAWGYSYGIRIISRTTGPNEPNKMIEALLKMRTK